MNIADVKADVGSSANATPPVGGVPKPRLHQIAEVRRQQGISLRSAARRMHLDVSEVRALENEATDMSLSMLYRFQEALEVPVASLLVEQDDPLSQPIAKRAGMVRLMKTAQAIKEKAETAPIQRMATMLIEQLVEIMPELKDVSPWHAVGQRRSLDEMGRIAEQSLPDDWFFSHGTRG